MKITNAEIIKNGEKDLIDSITADLDWRAIEDIFLKEHNLGIDEDIEYKNGDIVAYENQVAYQLDFTVKVNLTVLINRDGEYLSVNISGKQAGQGQGSAVSADPGRDGEKGAAVQEKEADLFEQKPTADDSEEKEDKYLEALGQLNSDELDRN